MVPHALPIWVSYATYRLGEVKQLFCVLQLGVHRVLGRLARIDAERQGEEEEHRVDRLGNHRQQVSIQAKDIVERMLLRIESKPRTPFCKELRVRFQRDPRRRHGAMRSVRVEPRGGTRDALNASVDAPRFYECAWCAEQNGSRSETCTNARCAASCADSGRG